MKNNHLIVFLLFVLLGQAIHAKVILPPIFSDNIVLQQQSKVLIWGKSDIGKEVSIRNSWNNKTVLVAVEKTGTWKVAIETPIAGGPYELVISDGEEVRLKNILIGEVWLCSGQSNMDIPLAGVPNIAVIKDANQYILNSNNSNLRFFTVDSSTGKDKLSFKGKWLVSNPESAAKFSAVGYLFAKQLQEHLNTPVGIIKCARSGTKIESWMSEKLLKDEFGISTDEKTPNAKPAELFETMVMQIAGYGIKGFLWYQGEGNHRTYELYSRQLPAMVKEWRNHWGMGDVPFYFAQLAPYDTKNGLSPYMRQAMAECVKTIPNSGIVLLTDAGEENNIHPIDKKIVADRFLYLALAKTYQQKGFGFCGPIFKSLEIKNNEAIVSFDYAESGLTSYGKELVNFEIAGKDTVYVKANAKLTKEGKVVVWSDSVKEPIGVRYAFKDFVVGELYNFMGLPASTFQSIMKITKK
jgi:sialate O-acetylesterase